MSFSELGLSQALLRQIERQGYDQPTPIQAQAIPAVLSGDDVLAAAQTGTGKTAAFTLPLLQTLSESDAERGREPRVLILTPTRELALQVHECVREYGAGTQMRSTVVFGGVSAVPQTKVLRQGVDILVATPGRLLDLCNQRIVQLNKVEHFVLDEADRMLDMGFIRDIRKVTRMLPAKRQNLMFSATFSPEIRTLAMELLDRPIEIDVAPRNTAAELISQKKVLIARDQKRDFLSWMIGYHNWQQVLIFTRTKHGANRLCKQLEIDGISAAALHGNKSQGARTKALAAFKSGGIRTLVATDIAARGIDIDRLPHVVNYDLPMVAEDYVHRIGRTGRAGTEGEALSLVDVDERKLLSAIERLIKRKIPELKVEGFHIKPQSNAAPRADKPAVAQQRRPKSEHKPAPGGRRRRRGGGGARAGGQQR